jgi:hypothetical protein
VRFALLRACLLELTNGPVEFIVVDHVEKPSDN